MNLSACYYHLTHRIHGFMQICRRINKKTLGTKRDIEVKEILQSKFNSSEVFEN